VLEQLANRRLHARRLVGFVPQKVHVQVAVTRVPVRDTAHAPAHARGLQPREQLAERLAWHRHVLAELVPGGAAQGSAHVGAHGPHAIARLRVLRPLDVLRALALAHGRDTFTELAASSERAVHLDQEQCFLAPLRGAK
jgi:hypothetical protein